MKTLLTIGDSHTFGAEILGEGNYFEKNKLYSFPQKLADLLGYRVDNLGESGASIKRTERVLVDYLARNSTPDLIVIGWTCLGRWEICKGTDEEGEYVYEQWNSWLDESHKRNMDTYNALLPIVTADDLLAEKYRTVIRCQQLIKSYNIPYIMFDVMEHTKKIAPISGSDKGGDKLDKLWSGTNSLDISLEKMIDTKYYISQVYWEYIMQSKKFPNVKINGGHSNEEGHRVWANFLFNKIKELY